MPRKRSSQLIIVAAVAVLVIGMLLYQVIQTRKNTDRLVGITLTEGDSEINVKTVVPDQPAARAGLLVGDRIVTMNGVDVTLERDYDEVASGFRRGEPAVYEVERDGLRLVLTVFPGISFPWSESLLGVLTSLAHLLLGGVILLQRPRDARARILFLLTAAVAIEFALPPIWVIGEPWLVWFSTISFYMVTGFQMGAELHLASVVPERQRWLQRYWWVIPGYYLVGLTTGLLPTLAMICEKGMGWQWLPWSHEAADAGLYNIAMPLWAIAVALLLANQAFRHPEPLGRHQAGLVLLAVIPWVAVVMLEMGLSVFGVTQPQWFDVLSTVAILFYPIAVFVAVFRYHLFDIELVVRRGLVYGTLTALLVAVFWLALAAGGALFSAFFGRQQTSIWVVSGATLLIGLLFSPLRAAVQQVITRRFFPERDALRRHLISLVRELPALGKLPLMGKHLVQQLADIFSVETATILIADPESKLLVTLATHGISSRVSQDWTFIISTDDPAVTLLKEAERPVPAETLAKTSASLAQRIKAFGAVIGAPLLSQDDFIGILMLGAKRGGEGFVAEESELLSLLAHHVATVFENARLFESATYESLTGLFRREAILELLNRELQRAQRYGRPLSLGMADLDHFKQVNDSFGHLTGDRLLQRVSEVLREGLRASDAIGRYGGEEFLFILPETSLEAAVMVAEKLRARIAGITLRAEDDRTIDITVSIGIASIDEPWEGEPPGLRDLLALADSRLLIAKGNGRNRVEPADLGGSLGSGRVGGVWVMGEGDA